MTVKTRILKFSFIIAFSSSSWSPLMMTDLVFCGLISPAELYQVVVNNSVRVQLPGSDQDLHIYR